MYLAQIPVIMTIALQCQYTVLKVVCSTADLMFHIYPYMQVVKRQSLTPHEAPNQLQLQMIMGDLNYPQTQPTAQ